MNCTDSGRHENSPKWGFSNSETARYRGVSTPRWRSNVINSEEWATLLYQEYVPT